MIEGTKKSLDYFTANFSPYQHKQVRILEFPNYARFAQSFANHDPVLGVDRFIADLRDPESLDYRSTSPRTRSGTSGGRTRSSARTRRARPC
jgi:hypothetical protein